LQAYRTRKKSWFRWLGRRGGSGWPIHRLLFLVANNSHGNRVQIASIGRFLFRSTLDFLPHWLCNGWQPSSLWHWGSPCWCCRDIGVAGGIAHFTELEFAIGVIHLSFASPSIALGILFVFLYVFPLDSISTPDNGAVYAKSNGKLRAFVFSSRLIGRISCDCWLPSSLSDRNNYPRSASLARSFSKYSRTVRYLQH
jgi:hypothetical protein